MTDPVILVETKTTYDRKSIEQWLLQHTTDPSTGLEIKSKEILPVLALKNAIEEWKNDMIELQKKKREKREKKELKAREKAEKERLEKEMEELKKMQLQLEKEEELLGEKVSEENTIKFVKNDLDDLIEFVTEKEEEDLDNLNTYSEKTKH